MDENGYNGHNNTLDLYSFNQNLSEKQHLPIYAA